MRECRRPELPLRCKRGLRLIGDRHSHTAVRSWWLDALCTVAKTDANVSLHCWTPLPVPWRPARPSECCRRVRRLLSMLLLAECRLFVESVVPALHTIPDIAPSHLLLLAAMRVHRLLGFGPKVILEAVSSLR